MSTYVISDIHGRLGAFHEMLKKIEFCDTDILYVLGDVVDRGPDGIRLLREIMEAGNIRMLIGNHELMMLDYFKPDSTQAEKNRWNRNRNSQTLDQFRVLSQQEKGEVLLFLESRPDWLEVTVKGQVYHLVHGWPGMDRHDCVWGRPGDAQVLAPMSRKRLIIGHTPVPLVRFPRELDMDRYFQELARTGGHVEILHAPGFIDIDCGCGHSAPGCCLGCLRLEDMQAFYTDQNL